MNVLVTGGAGYLGSVLAHQLLQNGHRVRILDSLLYGGASLPGLYPYDGFEFLHGDVRSGGTVTDALAGVDAVVHLAAIVGDPACARQPSVACAVNLDASLQLFESCRRREVQRFVFASTCSNYGKMRDLSQYATEESELHPVSLYAENKVGVEQALLAGGAGAYPALTLLRFATLYGVSPRMRFDLTVNEFAMELAVKRKLVVYGEQFWRPYVHVRDAARAVRMVLDQQDAPAGPQVYNVGVTRENFQKRQIVDVVRSQVEGDVEISSVRKEEDPRDYRVSFEKIRQRLGFGATRTVLDGVREVIDAVGKRVFPDLDHAGYRN